MKIKEIRKRTGMSQKRFAEMYNIPLRTLEDWETERREPADYLVDLLNKATQIQDKTIIAFCFDEYRDKAGTGSSKMFNNVEEAISYCKTEWNTLSTSDQKSYLKDECGMWMVSRCALTWDEDEEEYIAVDDSKEAIYNQLEEERKKEKMMTIREVKEMYPDAEDVEVYESLNNGTPRFHTDSIRAIDDYSDDDEVFMYEMMNEEEYNSTILANSTTSADFGEWYDNKLAECLCIIVK